MRHKLPYEPCMKERGADLSEGVVSGQCMGDVDPAHCGKGRHERQVSKAGQAVDDRLFEAGLNVIRSTYDY